MTPSEAPIDWTQGGDRLVYQRCAACGHAFYFRRNFCPVCGASDPATRVSAGLGTVHARTLVHRAPNEAFRAVVPYGVVLVDLAEGVRVMAHGDIDLAIGMPVSGRIETIAGVRLPYFSAVAPGDVNAT